MSYILTKGRQRVNSGHAPYIFEVYLSGENLDRVGAATFLSSHPILPSRARRHCAWTARCTPNLTPVQAHASIRLRIVSAPLPSIHPPRSRRPPKQARLRTQNAHLHHPRTHTSTPRTHTSATRAPHLFSHPVRPRFLRLHRPQLTSTDTWTAVDARTTVNTTSRAPALAAAARRPGGGCDAAEAQNKDALSKRKRDIGVRRLFRAWMGGAIIRRIIPRDRRMLHAQPQSQSRSRSL